MNRQSRYEYLESKMDKNSPIYRYYMAKKQQSMQVDSERIADLIYEKALADIRQEVRKTLSKKSL